MTAAIQDASRRVLFLPPSSRDGKLTQRILADVGILCDLCSTLEMLCNLCTEGVGIILLGEEDLDFDDASLLVNLLQNQPTWSDIPVLLLMRPGGIDRPSNAALKFLSNVVLIPRPMSVALLISAVQSALRARERQYEIKDHLASEERTRRLLQQLDHRKDAFLAMLGHELRTPLSAITLAAESLGFSELSSCDLEMREIIIRQAKHIQHLIGDLLDVSRIANGKMHLELQSHPLNRLLEQCARDLRKLHQQIAAEFDLQLLDQEVWIHVDKTRFNQVIYNLVQNSCKFSAESPQITIGTQLKARQSQVQVSVSDKGMGVDEETLATLFEPFAQAKGGEELGGLGLGLALVRGLVELLGGTVSAASEGLGKGTTISILLPTVASPKTTTEATQVTSGQTQTTNQRILLVDDRRDAVYPIQRLLEREGHQVAIAMDGSAALAEAATFHPHIVLCDIGLPPPLTGYDVVERLKRTDECRNTYMVAVTGYGSVEDEAKSRMAGFDYHVTKPLGIDMLQQIIGERPHFDHPDP